MLWGSPVLDERTIYVTDDRNLYGIDRATGQQKWELATAFTSSKLVLQKNNLSYSYTAFFRTVKT